jgi:hypothetical protein
MRTGISIPSDLLVNINELIVTLNEKLGGGGGIKGMKK